MNIQNRFRKLNTLHHWYEWYASCIKIFSHKLHKVVHINGKLGMYIKWYVSCIPILSQTYMQKMECVAEKHSLSSQLCET